MLYEIIQIRFGGRVIVSRNEVATLWHCYECVVVLHLPVATVFGRGTLSVFVHSSLLSPEGVVQRSKRLFHPSWHTAGAVLHVELTGHDEKWVTGIDEIVVEVRVIHHGFVH
jgi:hypothetical protein